MDENVYIYVILEVKTNNNESIADHKKSHYFT